MLVREKFICGRFALHNSLKSGIFAENFEQADENQALNMDDRSNGSLPQNHNYALKQTKMSKIMHFEMAPV